MPQQASLHDRILRAISAAAALGCLAFGGWLATHHPLAPMLVASAFVLWSAIVYLRPVAWLFVVPAALPIIDLAPWTGWLIVEEFDILVLGAAAGAYASIAWRRTTEGATVIPHAYAVTAHAKARARALESADGVRLSPVSLGLIGLFGVWTAIGLYRGFSAAAAPELGWFDGYYDASNSVRVAKSYLLTLLMLPSLLVEMRRAGPRAMDALAAGLVAGLGLASLAVLWERLAFPGLLNFSSDYRTTALFWEMHVGGAALDGFLALTVPFAIRELLVASTRARTALAVLFMLLAAYACLTTFSRGVYLAVSVSLGLLAVLLLTKGNAHTFPSAARAMLKGCALIAMMGVLSHWSFRAGGYRSLLAVLGVFALTLPLGNIVRNIPARGWVAGVALGVLAGTAGSAMALLLHKGIYVNFVLAFGCCALLLLHGQRSNGMPSAIAGLGTYVWLIAAAAGVALGWGGVPALRDSAVVLSILIALTLWNARARAPLWPRKLPTQGAIIGLAVLVGIAAAVFSGGAYMADRFSTSERDAAGRLQHWRDGIGLLRTPADWLLGEGAGRFPQEYMFNGSDREFPGNSRIASQNGDRHLVLYGPRHEVGFGEMFRVAQRVSAAPGAQYSIILDARAAKAALLHFELCERHLLYVERCAAAAVAIPASGEIWGRQVVLLDGAKLGGGPWYAPRLVFFAVAAESPGSRIEIDYLSLIGPDGRELLTNGNFAQEMAGWFTTSDRFHLPWHIKNLALNVLFDQGAVGLLLFVMLTGGALFRLVAGAARGHPIAPFLAAALAGFLLVGLFDSLLDVPRLAFLFYLLAFIGLVLPTGTSTDGAGLAMGTAADDNHSSGKQYRAAESANSKS